MQFSITNKIIVLDLDQTLIATGNDISELKDLGILIDPKLFPLRSRIITIDIEEGSYRGTGSRYKNWSVIRNYTKKFLIFCFSYFEKVIVWSAGKYNYVHEVVKQLFKDIKPPDLILTFDDIILDNGNVIKPLMKLLQIYPNMDLNDVCHIDDLTSTFSHNPVLGVQIPAYEPRPTVASIENNDTSLLQLMYWFLQPNVINTKISDLDKKKIFTIPHTVYEKTAIKNIRLSNWDK